MTIPSGPARALPTPDLAGAAVIARIRRLVVVALGAGVLYSIFVSGGKGGCAGSFGADGTYFDRNGAPTDVLPSCVSLTLTPSPIMFVAFAGIVLWALTRVLRRAVGEAEAMLTLDRAALAVAIVAIMGAVVAHVWFQLIPVYGIDDSGTYIWPFPFGSVEIETTPFTSPSSAP